MKKWFQNLSLLLLSLFISMIAFGQNEKSEDNNKPKVVLEKRDTIQKGINDSLNTQHNFEDVAKVVIEIETDSKGGVISAEYISKKSTGTIDQKMIDMAKRRAYKLKLGANIKRTIIFNFKIRG